jgi:hypothetical protein
VCNHPRMEKIVNSTPWRCPNGVNWHPSVPISFVVYTINIRYMIKDSFVTGTLARFELPLASGCQRLQILYSIHVVLLFYAMHIMYTDHYCPPPPPLVYQPSLIILHQLGRIKKCPSESNMARCINRGQAIVCSLGNEGQLLSGVTPKRELINRRIPQGGQECQKHSIAAEFPNSGWQLIANPIPRKPPHSSRLPTKGRGQREPHVQKDGLLHI